MAGSSSAALGFGCSSVQADTPVCSPRFRQAVPFSLARICRSHRVMGTRLDARMEHGGIKVLMRDCDSLSSSPRALLDSAKYRKQKAEEEARRALLQDDDDDEGTCPVDCVREFKTSSEFEQILADSKLNNSLVVVDFFRTACGSCKYIEKGFIKLCKGAGNGDAAVIFLKHNVVDEYEEQSEVAAGFKIRAVPLFHFYKNGELVEAFPTREKNRILTAIRKHTGQVPAMEQET